MSLVAKQRMSPILARTMSVGFGFIAVVLLAAAGAWLNDHGSELRKEVVQFVSLVGSVWVGVAISIVGAFGATAVLVVWPYIKSARLGLALGGLGFATWLFGAAVSSATFDHVNELSSYAHCAVVLVLMGFVSYPCVLVAVIVHRVSNSS